MYMKVGISKKRGFYNLFRGGVREKAESKRRLIRLAQ